MLGPAYSWDKSMYDGNTGNYRETLIDKNVDPVIGYHYFYERGSNNEQIQSLQYIRD